jgi:hypothetical protein
MQTIFFNTLSLSAMSAGSKLWTFQGPSLSYILILIMETEMLPETSVNFIN